MRLLFLWVFSIELIFSDVDHSVFYFHVVIRKDLIMLGTSKYTWENVICSILQNLIACTRHSLLCQGVIFIQFYCTRMKVIRGNFRGKVYFIYPFVHWTCYQRDVYMRVDSFGGETHHFYVPRYIHISFLYFYCSFVFALQPRFLV